jgi:hypothetical protein
MSAVHELVSNVIHYEEFILEDINGIFVECQGYLGLVCFYQEHMTNDEGADCFFENIPNFGAQS